MNNSMLHPKAAVISTMISGQRDDAWHWRDSDISQFSSEKLSNILRMSDSVSCKDDQDALRKVREELEKRAQLFKKIDKIKPELGGSVRREGSLE